MAEGLPPTGAETAARLPPTASVDGTPSWGGTLTGREGRTARFGGARDSQSSPTTRLVQSEPAI
jgi:hypothetical protein